MAQKNMLSARERRLRRAAARKGLSIRKVRRGQDRGRYLVVYPVVDVMLMQALVRAVPDRSALLIVGDMLCPCRQGGAL